jgi:hypothetical protein
MCFNYFYSSHSNADNGRSVNLGAPDGSAGVCAPLELGQSGTQGPALPLKFRTGVLEDPSRPYPTSQATTTSAPTLSTVVHRMTSRATVMPWP